LLLCGYINICEKFVIAFFTTQLFKNQSNTKKMKTRFTPPPHFMRIIANAYGL
jgi:hypothetical protein